MVHNEAYYAAIRLHGIWKPLDSTGSLWRLTHGLQSLHMKVTNSFMEVVVVIHGLHRYFIICMGILFPHCGRGFFPARGYDVSS